MSLTVGNDCFMVVSNDTPNKTAVQGSTYHVPVFSTPHRLDIVVDKPCLDEDLDRFMAGRAFLVDVNIGADLSVATGLLYQSCSRTVLGKDDPSMSAVISVSVEATHLLP
jgi:hypothetical protein